MRIWALVLFLASSAQAGALITIYDSGNTRSIVKYLSESPPKKLGAPKVTADTYGVQRFPLYSNRLTPGKVVSRETRLPHMNTPIFIIGNDTFSREWLDLHAAQLKKLNATGLIVTISTNEEFTAIKTLAPGVPIYPASGDDLAEQLGIQHYPVLVSNRSIEQ